MQFRSKTVAAVAASAVLVLGTGVMAATMVLDLRVPGLTATNVDAAAPAGAPPAGTAVTTEQTGATSGVAPPEGASPAGTVAGPASSAPGPSAAGPAAPGPAPAAFVAASGGGSTGPLTPAPAPTPTPTVAPTPPPTASSGIPPAPAGCSEPEWDAEHRYWKCHVDGPEGPGADD